MEYVFLPWIVSEALRWVVMKAVFAIKSGVDEGCVCNVCSVLPSRCLSREAMPMGVLEIFRCNSFSKL